MKENQSSEFRAFLTVHLTEPLYIVEQHQKSRNFKHFQIENPKSSALWDEQKFHIPKFGKLGQINAALYILDTCMHWIHTCVTRNA